MILALVTLVAITSFSLIALIALIGKGPKPGEKLAVIISGLLALALVLALFGVL